MNESVKFSLYLNDLAKAPLRAFGRVGDNVLTRLHRKNQQFNDELRRTGREASTAGSGLNQLASGARNLIGAYLGVEGLRSAWNITADIQQNRLALGLLFKDAEKGTAKVNALLSRKSPLKGTEMLASYKSLLAGGFTEQQADGTLTMLENIAAVAGTDALPRITAQLTQIRAAGVLQGDELRVLNELGIPIMQEMARQYGVTGAEFKKMTSEGKVGFEDVMKGLRGLTTESGIFAGAAEKLSEGPAAKLNYTLGRVAMQTERIFSLAMPLVNTMFGLANSFLESDAAVNTLALTLGVLGGAWVLHKSLAMGAALGMRAYNWATKIGIITNNGMAISLRGIGAALKSIPVLGWIALAVEGFILLWQHSETFRGALYGIGEMAKATMPLLKTLAKMFWALHTGQWKTLGGLGSQLKEQWKNLDLGAAWQRGMDKGKSPEADKSGLQQLADGGNSLFNAGGGNSALAAAGSGAGGSSSGGVSVGGGSSSSQRAIIVNIENLVREITIRAERVREGVSEMRDVLAQETINALRDVEVSYGR
jgi:tape measure domain-containing protein